MFAYRAENEKKKFLSATKAIVFEISIIVIVTISLLAALNYFNVLSLSKIVPILSFLPQQEEHSDTSKTQITNNTNDYPAVTNPVKVSLQASNSNIKNYVTNIQLKSQILDISSNAGIFNGKKGPVNYASMLKLKTNDFVRTWYYSQDELEKIKVFQQENGTKAPISFSDLKVGDTVDIELSNDVKSAKLIEMKITRTSN